MPYAMRPADMTPAMVESVIKEDVANIGFAMNDLRADLLAFADPMRLRKRLKYLQSEEQDMEHDFPLDEILQMMGAMGAPPGPRRKRRKR